MNKTLMMIHGMWVSGWVWENYATYFETRGYYCIVPTLRFHDVSPQEAPNPKLGTTSLLDYAEDLEKEIRELEEVPILMGWSMGGLLAQILGSRGLARALVLLTPAAPAGVLALRPSVVRSFWSTLMRWGFWRKPGRPNFEEAVYSELHLLPSEEQKRAYERFIYESGRAASEIGFAMFDPRKASAVDESKVTCPVLVVGAAEDRIAPASVVRSVAEKYNRVATYKEFPSHAHWVIAEPGWQEIAGYVNEWLKQLGS